MHVSIVSESAKEILREKRYKKGLPKSAQNDEELKKHQRNNIMNKEERYS